MYFDFDSNFIDNCLVFEFLVENGVTEIHVFQMSQREITEEGKELFFDHGAPLFTVSNPDVLDIVSEWESRGLVAEWKENFASFDCISRKFVEFEQVYISILL